ncbi:26S proteasome non-ATPase regulatory subunit 5 [Cichlidogyrus casuarinus]|uniref:26S proteasome non-ATPase regulatory subunit 5 n=1 Tax=Cichlidogyrus casuarinus TaxID=1844966 RepID=A0ABD2PUT3_9PLAT
MSLVEKLTNMISQITVEDKNAESYENILLLMRTLSEKDLKDLSEKCDLVAFFLSIDLSNSSHARIALDLAKIIFQAIDFISFANTHIPEISLGLRANNEISIFALDKLNDNLSKTSQLLDPQVFLAIFMCLADSLSSSELASKLMFKCKSSILKLNYFMIDINLTGDILFIKETGIAHFISLAHPPSVQLRIQEFLIQISCTNASIFGELMTTNLLDSIFHEVNSNDFLVQVNALSILRPLATTKHGNEYLKNKGTISEIIDKSKQLLNEVTGPLLLPNYISFLCSICHHHAADWFLDQRVVDIFKIVLQDSALSCYGTLMEGIAFVASNRDSIQIIDSQLNVQGQLGSYFQAVGATLFHNPDKRCALESLTFIFQEDGVPSEANSSITLSWLNLIGTPAVNVTGELLKNAQKPFPELRLAALKTLKMIALQLWGPKLLLETPALIEYMLDRSSEDLITEDKAQFVHLKFDFFSNLLRVADHWKAEGKPVLNTEQYILIKGFLKEGPWGVRTASSRAVVSTDT